MASRPAGSRELISARARALDVSGIRRVFELGAKLKDPLNFSIGQPDFAVPAPIKEAAIRAIRADRNGYTITQGIPALVEAISRHLADDVGWDAPSKELGVLVTSGTSGAILLAFLALLDPGDEAVIPDPYFVIYPALVGLAGGKPVYCDTYPDFRMTASRLEPLLTDRTKLVVINSPSNPSGVVLSGAELHDIVSLCDRRGVLILADEIYDQFTYDDAREDGRCPSAARFSQRLLLVRGFGKTYGCTGWRMGYAAGPRAVIDQMAKLQQYTFVCAPSIAQEALVGAFQVDMSDHVAAYQQKRDAVVRALAPVTEVVQPGGAFYVFPKVPERAAANASAFAQRAVERGILLIPGGVFSRRDTHLRLSYAVSDQALDRGLPILAELMGRR